VTEIAHWMPADRAGSPGSPGSFNVYIESNLAAVAALSGWQPEIVHIDEAWVTYRWFGWKVGTGLGRDVWVYVCVGICMCRYP
jgi:hypothetical protein